MITSLPITGQPGLHDYAHLIRLHLCPDTIQKTDITQMNHLRGLLCAVYYQFFTGIQKTLMVPVKTNLRFLDSIILAGFNLQHEFVIWVQHNASRIQCMGIDWRQKDEIRLGVNNRTIG